MNPDHVVWLQQRHQGFRVSFVHPVVHRILGALEHRKTGDHVKQRPQRSVREAEIEIAVGCFLEVDCGVGYAVRLRTTRLVRCVFDHAARPAEPQ